MGAKTAKVLSLQAAKKQPTYDQLSDALVEAFQENYELQAVCNNMAHWLNALADSHTGNDAWAVHDILDTYVKNRRPAFPQSGAKLH